MHVDSIIWAQSQGQVDASGTSRRRPSRRPAVPVKLVVAEADPGGVLAAGATGAAAIYTST
jgi:hypothetical protein